MTKTTVLSLEDVAKRFGVSKTTIVSWTKRKENHLKCVHPSKRIYRFEEKDISDFMKSNKK